MRLSTSRLGLLAAVAFVSGCTSGQSSAGPGVTPVDLNTNKAQLAVGVATFSDGTKGLNTVETFRQPDGLSATLANTPTITGPAGFVVPATVDAGTNGRTHVIDGSVQMPNGTTPPATTFGTTGGAFAYGFAPANSDSSGAANFGIYTLPFYGSPTLTGTFTDTNANHYPFEGGPPAYPNVRDGTFPAGFIGYTLGFTTFAAAPAVGTYTLSIHVTAANAGSATIVAPPVRLGNANGLGRVAIAGFAGNGAGGGTVTFTAPVGTTESFVDVYDVKTGTYYTAVVAGAGAHAATFADALGSITAGVAAPTFTTGDEYNVTVICLDYPGYEAGPPKNTQQTPALLGIAGQADVSFSPLLDGTY